MSAVTANETKVMKPGESIAYSMDFANILASGETLSTPSVSVSPSGPTLSAPTTSGTKVIARVSGIDSSMVGTTYRITWTSTTSSNNTRKVDSLLEIVDD